MANRNKSNYRLITLTSEVDAQPVSKAIENIIYYNEDDRVKAIEDPKAKIEPINLIINSIGGNVYDGFALIDAIEGSKTPIQVTGYGCIMSIALLIYVACPKRLAGKLATFLYHEPSFGVDYSKVQYHKQELIEAERLGKIYNDFLCSKTKFPREVIKDVSERQADYYFDVNKAKEYGIVHRIL